MEMVRRGSTVRVRQGASKKGLPMGLSVVCIDDALASRGYEAGTFSDERALAGSSDHRRGLPIHLPATESASKQTVYVAGTGARATTSFAREGSKVLPLGTSPAMNAGCLSRRDSRIVITNSYAVTRRDRAVRSSRPSTGLESTRQNGAVFHGSLHVQRARGKAPTRHQARRLGEHPATPDHVVLQQRQVSSERASTRVMVRRGRRFESIEASTRACPISLCRP
jgi:hypothetical protein